MSRISHERSRWLAANALPYESALRSWLAARPIANLEVDDIVQETYAILVRLDDVSHIKNAKAYMFQTARSVILQSLRRSRTVAFHSVGDLEGFELADDTPSPEREVSARHDLRQVLTAIGELSPKCRQAFVLHKLEGFSEREVARRMGVSESTIEKHVAKGVHFLVDALSRGKIFTSAADGGEQPFRVSSIRTVEPIKSNASTRAKRRD